MVLPLKQLNFGKSNLLGDGSDGAFRRIGVIATNGKEYSVQYYDFSDETQWRLLSLLPQIFSGAII
jgi:hypothetical protein